MKVRVDRIIYYFLQKGFVVNDANKPSNKPTNQHASHTSLHNSTILIPLYTKMSTCRCPLNLLKYCEKWSIHHFARLNICLSGGEKYLILERLIVQIEWQGLYFDLPSKYLAFFSPIFRDVEGEGLAPSSGILGGGGGRKTPLVRTFFPNLNIHWYLILNFCNMIC